MGKQALLCVAGESLLLVDSVEKRTNFSTGVYSSAIILLNTERARPSVLCGLANITLQSPIHSYWDNLGDHYFHLPAGRVVAREVMCKKETALVYLHVVSSLLIPNLYFMPMNNSKKTWK